MSEKFIPNGDFDFAQMAEGFSRTLANDPARFALTREDVEALSTAVLAFRAALNTARGGSRSIAATLAKENARQAAEQIVRKLAAMIRANDKIDALSKEILGLRQRPARVKQQPCPAEPPRLAFARALHEGSGAIPMHELKFSELHAGTSRKPPGAARLELFVDLIPPDEPIPAIPGANHGGRPWYLRSFTRSPIVITPPMTRVPMRVVYWGRWADSSGNVGPFSATTPAWIEGGSAPALPGGVPAHPDGRNAKLILENTAPPPAREPTINVLVLEAQYQSLHPRQLVEPVMVQPSPQITAQPARERRQLEGPAVEQAA